MKAIKKLQKTLSICLAAACLMGTLSLNAFAAPRADIFERLNQSEMSATASCAQSSEGPGRVLDGNNSTLWHSPWAGQAYPHTITIDLGSVKENVCRFLYLPRQDKDINGIVRQYEIYAGTDPDNLVKVASGIWSTADRSEKSATFRPVQAQYVMMKVLDAQNDNTGQKYSSAAEINIATSDSFIYDKSTLSQAVKDATAKMAEYQDEDFNRMIQPLLDEAQIVNDNETAAYEDVLRAGNALANAIAEWDSNDFIVLDQSKMSASANSAQSGEGAQRAIDGNRSTLWHSLWNGSVPYPHHITLDLGDTYSNVSLVRYLPRQDKDTNGMILKYEVYAGEAQDDLKLVARGSWDSSKDEKTATFPGVTARYVQLVCIEGMTDSSGNPYTSAAEINIATKRGVVIDQMGLPEKVAEAKSVLELAGTEFLKQSLQALIDEAEALLADPATAQEEYPRIIEALDRKIEFVKAGGYTSFTPGEVWYDTDGVPIQAHGGCVMYDEITRKYYFYGEHKTISTSGSIPAVGVSCYSSTDLYNWTNEGVALPVFNNTEFKKKNPNITADTPMYVSESSPEFQRTDEDGTVIAPKYDTLDMFNKHDIDGMNRLYAGLTPEKKAELFADYNTNVVVERPKVIYNDKTGKYVMWMHLDSGDYSRAEAGVAISDSPTGPFTFIESKRLNNSVNGGLSDAKKGMARDMTLFKDDDGTAYAIYASEDNATEYISRLDDEYIGLAGEEEGVDFVRIQIKRYREAPAMFKYRGKYYLVTSGQSGWAPNRASYAVADDIFGPWTEVGDPCIGDTQGTTFRSQSTYVLPVRDKNGNIKDGQFIYMGDRWTPPKLYDSRYIWLPIDMNKEDGTISFGWQDEWDLSYFHEDSIPGDIDGDGVLNLKDLISVKQMILRGEYSEIADCNADGRINIFDLLCIKLDILNQTYA